MLTAADLAGARAIAEATLARDEILQYAVALVRATRMALPQRLFSERDLARQEPQIQLTYKIYGYLVGQLRDYSVENWSYLTVDGRGVPHLSLQGNIPFNAFVMSVSMNPGGIALAVMPREPTSRASDLVNPMMPALAAA